MFGIIYKITNKLNGKSYVGQTVQKIEKRWSNHHSKGRHSCLFNSIQKYGKENFKIEILGTFLRELLNLAETAAIKEYNTLSPRGYNLLSGGTSCFECSEATRSLMSKIVNERYKDKTKCPMTGKHHSKETKERISKALLGKKIIYKNGPRHPLFGKKWPSHPMSGKHLSEDHKGKLSESHRGKRKPLSGETKRKISEAHKRRCLRKSLNS